MTVLDELVDVITRLTRFMKDHIRENIKREGKKARNTKDERRVNK